MLGFVDPLLALGYRVCVLDLPGHGLSPQTATHLLDTSLALETMASSFGPFQSIVAHSYGAAAICLALQRRPSLTPKRLALISPMQDIDQHLGIFASIALLSPERISRLRNRVERLLGCPPEQLCALRAVQELDVSALVIHDQHDPVIPHDAGELLARNLRGARFVSTSHLGHRRVLKCPSVLAEVLEHHRSSQSIA
jgi:pimeloyl-ACP methyl ester carboxylesterase